jgi:hypothetical protein
MPDLRILQHPKHQSPSLPDERLWKANPEFLNRTSQLVSGA